MLSPGQIHALKTKTKIDGTEASQTYMKSVTKTVKLKLYDACLGLEQVYRDFPEFRDLIDSSLSWHGREKVDEKPTGPNKNGKSTVPDDWPDDPSVGDPIVVDRAKAFKDFHLD